MRKSVRIESLGVTARLVPLDEALRKRSPDWADLPNWGLSALIIGHLERAGVTREQWGSIAAEDRRMILHVVELESVMTTAIEMLVWESDERLKAHARRYLLGLLSIDERHGSQGFRRELVRRSRLEPARVLRDALRLPLGTAKVGVKSADSPSASYGAWVKAVSDALAQKDLRAEIHEADIRGLLKKSAKTIANEIAARTFKLNVDDLKLRAPRHRTRPKKPQ